MAMTFKINTDGVKALGSKLQERAKDAEFILALQAKEDTSPYVPMLTGSLDIRTVIKENRIIYPGPYARYLYYGKVMVDSVTGKGPMHFVDKNGNEQIKFRKGAKLVATARDLKINRASHPKAQAHWFEASKAENLAKWERVVGKAVSGHDNG